MKRILFLFLLTLCPLFFMSTVEKDAPTSQDIPKEKVKRLSFAIEIKTMGELDAAKSTSITSLVRGDQGKIIFLVPDGTNVEVGDLLVKLDPTPFEGAIQENLEKIKEQKNKIEAIEQSLKWELEKAEHDKRSQEFEFKTAALEIQKISEGDGPLEIARLQSALLKAQVKLEEVKGYSEDLEALEKEGFLNVTERKQVEKKVKEETEAFENAKLQYESYIHHVLPLTVQKAQLVLEKMKSQFEEASKAAEYKIQKEQLSLHQAYDDLNYYQDLLRLSEEELHKTEMKAPYSGMVVHKEEFRSGQRRKPRVGDPILKNQPLLDLPDLHSMIVKTKVREIDLHKVRVGTPATIKVDAYPDANFTGRVISIGVLALNDLSKMGEEKYFDLNVAFESSEDHLRPGMTARVTLHSSEVLDGLTIPIYYLYEDVEGPYCYVLDNNLVPLKRYLKTGRSNEQWIEILHGLSEDEGIVLLP